MFSFQGTSELHSLKEALGSFPELFVQRTIYLMRFTYSLFTITSYLVKVVGQSGLEPPTSRLSVVCSSQLSYWPVFGLPADRDISENFFLKVFFAYFLFQKKVSGGD